MNEKITERTYPIEGKWIFKSTMGSVIIILFLTPFFLFGLTSLKLGPILIIFIALIPFSLIAAFLQKANFHYTIEDKFITLKQGILSKQQRHIPYGVIQNIFVKQDLFDRFFGLASLTVENASQGAGSQTAGTRQIFGMVNIPGLAEQNAQALRAIVLQKMKENPIEDSQS